LKKPLSTRYHHAVITLSSHYQNAVNPSVYAVSSFNKQSLRGIIVFIKSATRLTQNENFKLKFKIHNLPLYNI